MAGPAGSAAMSACQVTAVAGERRRLDGAEARAGLDEVDARRIEESRPDARGAQQVGHQRAAARPELGEDEGRGAPIACQAATAQRPISSPNIWLTSGAVTKSPARPNGSRRM